MDRYNTPEKKKVRHEMIKHAIDSLTVDRRRSSIIQKDDLRAMWTEVQQGLKHLDNASIESIENQIKKLEKEIDGNSCKEASDLKVVYLAGPNPLNDFEVFVKNGILPTNIFAVEEDTDAVDKGIKKINESNEYKGDVNIFNGSFKLFCQRIHLKFDLIYYDTCGTLTSKRSLQDISTIFEKKKLAPLGVLITNFSLSPNSKSNSKFLRERQEMIKHLTSYLECRLYNINEEYIKEFVSDSICNTTPTGDDEATSCIRLDDQHLLNNPTQGETSPQFSGNGDRCKEFEDFIKNIGNVEEIYGYSIIFLISDLASIFKPALSMYQTKEEKSIWHQIGQCQKSPPKGLEPNDQWPQKQDRDNVFQDKLLSTLMLKHVENPNNELVNAIFPSTKNYDKCVSEFLSVFCTWLRTFRFEYCNKHFETKVVKSILAQSSKPLNDQQQLMQLLFSIYYGKYALPSFPVLDKHLSLEYTGTGNTRKMFCDVFVFDDCRTFFDYVRTVHSGDDVVAQPRKHIVLRVMAECMRRKLGLINKELNQTYSSLCAEELPLAAFSTLPERREIKVANSDVPEECELKGHRISQPNGLMLFKKPEEHEHKYVVPLENKSLYVAEDRAKMEGLPLGQDAEYNKRLHHASNKSLLGSAITTIPTWIHSLSHGLRSDQIERLFRFFHVDCRYEIRPIPLG